MGKKFAYSGAVDDGFKMMDEGTYIFKIVSAKYDDLKDSVAVGLTTKAGEKHTEFYNLVKNNGDVNEFQVKNIVRLCATALEDASLKKQPFDTDTLDEIVGKFIEAEVQHSTYNGKTRAQLNPWSYAPAQSFISDDLDEL